jgi:hypothetical protein
MAAQDLLGSPRKALAYPYLTLKPGLPGSFDRMAGGAERLHVTATQEPGGIHLEGTVDIPISDRTWGSAAEAWRRMDAGLPFGDRIKLLHAEYSATLTGNEALVIPIGSEGLFPETLVLSFTAKLHPLKRVRWQPPSTRAPIQVDGWVLTWPRAEQEWFASRFDYKGIPEMISLKLGFRKDTSMKGITSEAAGTLNQAEVEKLIAAFRNHAGVTVERVEPFAVKQHLSSFSTEKDRTPFSAAGAHASLLMHVDERHISPDLMWDAPVFHHLSSSPGYGLISGTSLCVLLPGPADPEKIQMLILRCVNPDAAPAP